VLFYPTVPRLWWFVHGFRLNLQLSRHLVDLGREGQTRTREPAWRTGSVAVTSGAHRSAEGGRNIGPGLLLG
jgi:hypothetical protein